MPDDAPQTGQRVWREPDYGYGYRTYLAKGDPYFMGEGLEPGVWHSLDPKALAEMRSIIGNAMAEVIYGGNSDELEDRVMQALGLTPPEPKEGGAS